MAIISDILLIAGALGAAFYCLVLSRRLSRFNNLEAGMGGAIAALSDQVGEMTKTLERAHAAAAASTGTLDEATERAEMAAKRLEFLLASMHDLPGGEASNPVTPKPAPAKPGGPTFLRSPRAQNGSRQK